MTQTLAPRDGSAILENVIVRGDLSGLNPEQRVDYYRRVCDSVGLNPFTKPFEYLMLDGKLVLYARKDCTDQLRDLRSVSITRLEKERMEDLYVITAYASLPDGRQDSAIGAVSLAKENGEWATSQSGKRYFRGNGTFSPLNGDALANAIMKAETKAKRRVTLSICGLGFTDESELETIQNVQPVEDLPNEVGEAVVIEGTARPTPVAPAHPVSRPAPAAASARGPRQEAPKPTETPCDVCGRKVESEALLKDSLAKFKLPFCTQHMNEALDGLKPEAAAAV